MENRKNRTVQWLDDCANRLKKARLACEKTRPEMAEACNIALSTWGHWENGTRQIDPYAIVQLREKYGITHDYIYHGDASGLPVRLYEKIKDAE